MPDFGTTWAGERRAQGERRADGNHCECDQMSTHDALLTRQTASTRTAPAPPGANVGLPLRTHFAVVRADSCHVRNYLSYVGVLLDDEAMELALARGGAGDRARRRARRCRGPGRRRVVAPATTSGRSANDPTAHAEVLALADAAAALGTWRLGAVTLVVTLEPCPMCAGALVAGRVGRLVFGTDRPEGRRLRDALQPLRRPPPQPRGPGHRRRPARTSARGC